MNTCVLFTFRILCLQVFCAVFIQASFSEVRSELKSKHKVQLAPKSIDGRLGELVTIQLPKTQTNTKLYLTDPSGNIITLTPSSKLGKKFQRKHHDNKYERKEESENTTMFRYIGKRYLALGPLTEAHDGNWVLSKLYKNSRGETIEEYKFITIRIIEHTPPGSSYELLPSGETFSLGLRHAPPSLQTCELIPPSTTYDKYYERALDDLSTCTYNVPNVTTQDTGIWTLVAVGKIAYMAEVELNVVDKLL